MPLLTCYIKDCTQTTQHLAQNFSSWTHFHLLKLQARHKSSLGASKAPYQEDGLFLHWAHAELGDNTWLTQPAVKWPSGWGMWHFLTTSDFQSCWVTLQYLNMYLLSLRNGIWTSERDFSSSKGGESPYSYLILNSVIPTEIRTPGQNLHSQQIPWIWCGACSWKGQWWHPLLAPHTPCSPRGAQWTAPAERQQKSDLRDHFPKICPSCSTRNQTKPAENSAPLLLLRRNIR